MRGIILFTTLFLVCGCHMFVYPETLETTNGFSCKPYVYPRVSPIPAVPDIPTSRMGDRVYVENILIEKIDDLRKYSADMQHLFYDAYREHANSCR